MNEQLLQQLVESNKQLIAALNPVHVKKKERESDEEMQRKFAMHGARRRMKFHNK